MKRILVIGQSDNPGGVEAVIKRYYEVVNDQIQFDLLVFTDICYDQEYYRNHGCNIFFIKNAQFRHPFKYKNEVRNFFSKRRNDYDAIWFNCCDLANCGYIMKQAKKSEIKKRIIHAHNNQLMQTGKKRYFYQLVHNYWKYNIDKYATDYWACSELAGQFFYKKQILSNQKYRVINNAIRVCDYKRDNNKRKEIRREWGISEDCTVIGHVGRFQYQKNHDFIIDIYNDYCKENSNSKLVLVGQGVEQERIRKKVENLALDNKVMFLGVRNDVNDLLQAMDVFLLPSRFEGLGIVLVEAQAAGLPCVTSKKVVPSNVNITGNVEFIGLDEPISKWVNAIKIQEKKDIDYDKCEELISQAGYDIEIEGEKFKQLICE